MKRAGKMLLPETLTELREMHELSQQTEGKGKKARETDEAREARENYEWYMIAIPDLPRQILRDVVENGYSATIL